MSGGATKTPTTCQMCYNSCSILATKEDDTVTYLEWNPASPLNQGRMCAKSKAGIMNLYNPNRVRAPLVRANESKGLDEDPGWEEPSWDHVLETIADRLGAISDDPEKLLINLWDFWYYRFSAPPSGSGSVPRTCRATCPGRAARPSTPSRRWSPVASIRSRTCTTASITSSSAPSRAWSPGRTSRTTGRVRRRPPGRRQDGPRRPGGKLRDEQGRRVALHQTRDGRHLRLLLHVRPGPRTGDVRPGLPQVPLDAPYLVGPDGLFLRDESAKPLIWDLAGEATRA